MAAAAEELQKAELLPEEEEYEYFDFDSDDFDPDYREVYAEKDGNTYILSGKQLQKIFDSTNFNDMGSLRYLYKYLEKRGAIEKLWKWVLRKAIPFGSLITNLNIGTNIDAGCPRAISIRGFSV